jgi:hypothetical protein
MYSVGCLQGVPEHFKSAYIVQTRGLDYPVDHDVMVEVVNMNKYPTLHFKMRCGAGRCDTHFILGANWYDIRKATRQGSSHIVWSVMGLHAAQGGGPPQQVSH